MIAFVLTLRRRSSAPLKCWCTSTLPAEFWQRNMLLLRAQPGYVGCRICLKLQSQLCQTRPHSESSCSGCQALVLCWQASSSCAAWQSLWTTIPSHSPSHSWKSQSLSPAVNLSPCSCTVKSSPTLPSISYTTSTVSGERMRITSALRSSGGEKAITSC